MCFAVVVVVLLGGYRWGWDWVGIGPYNQQYLHTKYGKTVWDWLQLLIVPGVVVIGGAVLNRLLERRRAQIEDDRQQEAAIEAYMDRMSDLLLTHNLWGSKSESEGREVARGRTMNTLRRVNAERQGHVIQFLADGGLLNASSLASNQPKEPVIDLRYINLRGIQLRNVIMTNVQLDAIAMNEARLNPCFMISCKLHNVQMERANLSGGSFVVTEFLGCDLKRVRMNNAQLSHAIFSKIGHLDETASDLAGADLSRSNLTRSDLIGVNLTGARLRGAILEGTNLALAQVSKRQLRSAKSLGPLLRSLREQEQLDMAVSGRHGTELGVLGATHQRVVFAWRRDMFGAAHVAVDLSAISSIATKNSVPTTVEVRSNGRDIIVDDIDESSAQRFCEHVRARKSDNFGQAEPVEDRSQKLEQLTAVALLAKLDELKSNGTLTDEQYRQAIVRFFEEGGDETGR
jgi:uncharacterized protein YjbI with pentapeptide repeats